MLGRGLCTTAHELPIPGLAAALDGLRILQISDLHDTRFGPADRDLLTAIASARPDLLALTGDILDRGTADLGPLRALAGRLLEIAPALAVPGNHEGGTPLGAVLLDDLAAAGVTVLRDARIDLPWGGAALRVAGIDDPRLHGGSASRPFSPALDRSLIRASLDRAGVPERRPPRRSSPTGEVPVGPGQGAGAAAGAADGDGAVDVLLAHRSEMLDIYAEREVSLVLTGHAHGGQWRPPRTQGLYAPNQGLLPRRTAGIHRRGGTAQVISRGLKVRRHLPRLGNPPELVLVVLRAA